MINVSIPAGLEGLVNNLVLSGNYRDPSEVVGKALLILKNKEQLRKDIQAGTDELDQGLGRHADDVFSRLMEKAGTLSGNSTAAK